MVASPTADHPYLQLRFHVDALAGRANDEIISKAASDRSKLEQSPFSYAVSAESGPCPC